MYLAVQVDRCPYCCSQDLIWDYGAGIVVCSSCGSVIDTIYDFYQYPDSFVELGSPKQGRHRFSYVPKSLKEIEKNRRKVELAERRARSMKVIRSLPKDVRKVCEYGIELAYKISPSLVEGKCLRSRYAVGYTLYMLSMGRPIDVEEISKMFRVSISTARRLAKGVAHRLNAFRATP